MSPVIAKVVDFSLKFFQCTLDLQEEKLIDFIGSYSTKSISMFHVKVKPSLYRIYVKDKIFSFFGKR